MRKSIQLKIAVLVIAAAALPLASRAESLAVRNCTWCHGGAAQGYGTAPRLAGQRAAYIERQLASFREHTRDAPFSRQYMWAAAGNLSRATMRRLAEYFSSLTPRSAADGDRALVAAGRSIYQLGVPDANIVACVACHGPDAEGVRDIPRLGGLAYSYLERRLEQWKQGYHSALARPMPDIASRLAPHQIEALASYLSFIKYSKPPNAQATAFGGN